MRNDYRVFFFTFVLVSLSAACEGNTTRAFRRKSIWHVAVGWTDFPFLQLQAVRKHFETGTSAFARACTVGTVVR